MNTQDRAVVKALLQYMTDKCLTGSPEFRAAVKQFAVTTTWYGKDIEHDESAKILGVKHNHFVDVYYPSRIDAHPHGERFKFETKAEADAFAAHERANGDEPSGQDVIEAAHAEALEDDAAVNALRVTKEVFDAEHAANLEPEASVAKSAHPLLMRAIHVAANSFGGIIGEAEELVDALCAAGLKQIGLKVEQVIDQSLAAPNQSEQRVAFITGLRAIDNSL